MSVYDERMRYVQYLQFEERQCDIGSIFMQQRTSQTQELEIWEKKEGTVYTLHISNHMPTSLEVYRGSSEVLQWRHIMNDAVNF